mmetsp:Transcript_7776/g.15182  ORF Transcript_7776/g.15182 Transcript_7776/m.15182 type:complete len:112 (-) Transcript_7776:186-521(-)
MYKMYCVVATVKTKPQCEEEFVASLQNLAEYVKTKEEGADTYYIIKENGDNGEYKIIERYISKEYFDEVHKTSEPFLAFFGLVQKNELEVQISEGVEQFGFVSKKQLLYFV